MARLLALRGLRSSRGLADALSNQGATSNASGLEALLGCSSSATARPPSQWALDRLRAFGCAPAAQQQQEEQQPEGGSSVAAGPSSSATGEAPTRAQDLPPGTHDFRFKELVMLWTCGRCDTRSAKAFSKQSYESGLVIVRCPGCQAQHLIADHLGWFGQKGTVEDFAKEKGGMVMRHLADGTVELTPQEILGASGSAAAAAEALAESAAAAAASGGTDMQAAAAGRQVSVQQWHAEGAAQQQSLAQQQQAAVQSGKKSSKIKGPARIR